MAVNVSLVLLVIFIVALFVIVGRLLWVKFRLRRALFVTSRQILWSRKFAPRNKLVLDVGAGNNPHLRADILCEKYLFDDYHRGGGAATDLPLVVGDASALPFKSESIDVIVSSNVIEHLEDPAGFFHEAGRVAQSGFFTAPSGLQECLCSYGYHSWMIEQQEDTLIFQAKDREIIYPRIHEFFSKRILNNNLGVDQFTIDHWNALVIDYQWEGKPKIEVRGEPFKLEVKLSTLPTDPVATHMLHGIEKFRASAKFLIRKIIHSILSAQQTVDLTEILACPSCHGSVSISTEYVRCSQCNLDYPTVNGVPIMLLDQAIPSEGKRPTPTPRPRTADSLPRDVSKRQRRV